MEDVLHTREKAKYEVIWNHPDYGGGQQDLLAWEAFREWVPITTASAVVLGCGAGKLVAKLVGEGYDAYGVDITEEALRSQGLHTTLAPRFYEATLWDLPEELTDAFDLGICTDVMEHIPTEKVRDVFRNIFRVARTTLFAISLGEDQWGPRVLGEPLHLTVRHEVWWGKEMKTACPEAHIRLLRRIQRPGLCHYRMSRKP